MALTGSFKSAAFSAKDSAQSLHNKLHSEVYGGSWNDDVGQSYVAYSDALQRIADNIIDYANKLESIENSLASVNEKADRAKLESLKAAVQRS